MIGMENNPGIVPQVAEKLFMKMKEIESKTKYFEVSYSMLEIYNEKTQDLLINPGQRPSGGLKIRESKTVGIYVENLSKHPV